MSVFFIVVFTECFFASLVLSVVWNIGVSNSKIKQRNSRRVFVQILSIYVIKNVIWWPALKKVSVCSFPQVWVALCPRLQKSGIASYTPQIIMFTLRKLKPWRITDHDNMADWDWREISGYCRIAKVSCARVADRRHSSSFDYGYWLFHSSFIDCGHATYPVSPSRPFALNSTWVNHRYIYS